MGKKSGKVKDNVKKAQLIDPSREHGLTDKFRIVLREVFERFDEDKDGVLNREELQNFAVAANAGSDLEDDEVEQLQQFFECNDKGHLTMKGFFQMYHMQTSSRSSDTWKDMQRLGVPSELRPGRRQAAPHRRRGPAREAGSRREGAHGGAADGARGDEGAARDCGCTSASGDRSPGKSLLIVH